AEQAREEQHAEEAGDEQPAAVIAELGREHAALGGHALAGEGLAERLHQVGIDHRPVVENDVGAGRDADEQVLREIVEGGVLVEETEHTEREQRPNPDAHALGRGERGEMQAHDPDLRPFVHCTTLPSTMHRATKKCASDCASMPRVALPFSWRAFSYSAAPAMPPSRPRSWCDCRYG